MLYMVIERYLAGPGPVYARVAAAWTGRWDDLVSFEIIPVVTSAEAAAAQARGG